MMKILKTYNQLFENKEITYNDLLNAILNNDVDFFKDNINLLKKFNIDDMLNIAASNCKEDIIKFLINIGADVNYTDRVKWTPLLYAAFNECFECVFALLDVKNINLFHTDIDGKTFMDYLDDKNKLMIKEKYPKIYNKWIIEKQAKKFNI